MDAESGKVGAEGVTVPMTEHTDANRSLWDAWTKLHVESELYDLAGFKAGRNSLRVVEMEELAPLVPGRSLLHLMCHFGMDTLSWARLGAQATGVDLSPAAMTVATALAQEMKLPARFVCAAVEDLPDRLTSQFDIVFMSYGVLHWLPDLKRLGQVITHFLQPGGLFYIVEFHPFMRVFDSDDPHRLTVSNEYWFRPEPYRLEMEGSYAQKTEDKCYGYNWNHSLGEFITVLAEAGLRIEYLHEHQHGLRAWLPIMQQGDDGLWRLPEDVRESVPLMYSLLARK